jgi:hypothetical protein
MAKEGRYDHDFLGVTMNGLTLFFAIGAYFAFLCVATLASQPARIRLVGLVDVMLDEHGWNDEERKMLKFMAQTCSSSAAGLLLLPASVYGFVNAIVRGYADKDPQLARLDKDHRHKMLVVLYVVSIAGASPVAALVAFPFMLAAATILAIWGNSATVEAVDGPVRQVSGSFQLGGWSRSMRA